MSRIYDIYVSRLQCYTTNEYPQKVIIVKVKSAVRYPTLPWYPGIVLTITYLGIQAAAYQCRSLGDCFRFRLLLPLLVFLRVLTPVAGAS